MAKATSHCNVTSHTAALRLGTGDRGAAARLTFTSVLPQSCDSIRDVRTFAAADDDDGEKDVDIDELARRLSSEAQRMREGSDTESTEPPTPLVPWTQAGATSVPVAFLLPSQILSLIVSRRLPGGGPASQFLQIGTMHAGRCVSRGTPWQATVSSQ